MDDEQEAEDEPPPSVPFFRLFVYADPLDWTLMILGSVAAAVHGAALPAYLFILGKIISLFGEYQRDLDASLGSQLSPGVFQTLGDEILRVKHFLLILIFIVTVQNSSKRKVERILFGH